MGRFLHTVKGFRVLWLRGFYGTGKTSLAVELALRYLVMGVVDHIVSNVAFNHLPVVGTVSSRDAVEIRRAAFVVDEAWQFLASGEWKKAKDWIAFPRKRKQIYLFPSALPLTSYVRAVQVERLWNGLPLGVPCWRYAYTIDGGEGSVRKVKPQKFFWWYPQTVFGMYDHEQEPGDTFYVYGFKEVSRVEAESGAGLGSEYDETEPVSSVLDSSSVDAGGRVWLERI